MTRICSLPRYSMIGNSMSMCPCNSELELGRCCGPLLSGALASTPEALMRSRYTAFTQNNLDYIEGTCSEDALASFSRVDFERSLPETTWAGFEVRSSSPTDELSTEGFVTFTVRYRFKERDMSQSELARFVKIDGRWLYNDSEINPKAPPVRVQKPGRNDPCFCGSGKKY